MTPRVLTCIVCVASALLLHVVGGCKGPQLSPGSEPLFSGGTLFSNDELSVSVMAALHDPAYGSRAYEPQIQEVRVLVDGKPVDVASRVTSWWGKGGWHQTASFEAPPNAKSVIAVLKIKHIGKMFRMTVPFTHAEPGSMTKWRAGEVKTESID